LRLGSDFLTLQGKIVHGGNLHASKEKGKEEKETLTVSETLPRTDLVSSNGLSREAPVGGLFSAYPIHPPNAPI
jgi:hypothetical protein